ncbi:MAG: hypothetical protein IAA31_00560 [Candidatus Anaerobiospirillum merdipullorum]|uniref:HTH lysR-type domain-containing protein n=1 Tax=Candidatus Anaerobiospirillum merdipullorum TaxID=2838450 RepID=A0A9E2KMM5_9GAMM|nr:hypothetical protein [Candidatus Anaerobiospirillum merdipullorum]
MIHDLEEEWQLVLLERGKAGVKLTSAGMKLLPYAQEVCAAYATLQMQVDELNGLQSGLIRIGTFSSVVTHWLPKIIKEFQKNYPHIDYELLLGDYGEIEAWIAQGRVDCGFVCLPTSQDFEVLALAQDRLLAILPPNHPLATADKVALKDLCDEPFMLLEKGGRAEITALFARYNLRPQVHFTTWDDYAIMSMVESGLGISILPELILQRVPYQIVAKPLDVPAYRQIGLELRSKQNASPAVKHFYLYIKSGQLI